MSPSLNLPSPQFFYETAGKNFYIPTPDGKWVAVNSTNFKSHLKKAGFSGRPEFGAIASAIDEEIVRVQTEAFVDCALPLAGHAAGRVVINNRPILITETPTLIEAKPGEWPTIASVLGRMFTTPEHDQLSFLYGWLHVAISASRCGAWQPGQVCVLAGPVNSGKSLVQKLITELLGGRSAPAFQFIAGGTPFNADLFRAEHLTIEDKAESYDMRVRRHIGAAFKEIAVNNEHSFHPKGKTPVTLKPFWRLTVSVNDEPERLQVIPPIDEDLRDKIMLFQIQSGEMPMPTRNAVEQQQFWDQLKSELPAFIDFLIRYEIPGESRCSRFGIRHFHHPALLEALSGLTPQARLLELIDCAVRRMGTNQFLFEGTAAELERELYDSNNAVAQQARTLFTFPNACATYLGRLVREMPERVLRIGRSRYRILSSRALTSPSVTPNAGV